MGAAENRRIVEKWYSALSEGDFDTVQALLSDDVVFHLFGHTPLSGRHVGKAAVFGKILPEHVLAPLMPETIKFGTKWRIMVTDDQRVAGLMQGGGMGRNGEVYDQNYCHIFTIREGLIVEVHEIFDTVLVEKVLFDNPLQRPRTKPDQPFGF